MQNLGKEDDLEVGIIFKIAAVGILVSVLSQILKHSGRDEQAFLAGMTGAGGTRRETELTRQTAGSISTTSGISLTRRDI